MVRPKKHLGQHFLKDKKLALKIVDSLRVHNHYDQLLEIGPGKGILTGFLFDRKEFNTWLIEIDDEAIEYLVKEFPDHKKYILHGDFLEHDLSMLGDKFGVIGNFPYNISSQILFRILDERNRVQEVVGMFQKEVADRLCSPKGNKTYGKLTVLLNAFYSVKNLFTVGSGAFFPVPKVRSSVIHLIRNDTVSLPCNEHLFMAVVKQGFQNRRKILWNALKPLNLPTSIQDLPVLKKRAEQLGVDEFVELCLIIEKSRNLDSIPE
jgi:16S rRNA (adenine1518-N6/adenine1519-N6)-dimethyltransferase